MRAGVGGRRYKKGVSGSVHNISFSMNFYSILLHMGSYDKATTTTLGPLS